MAEPVKASPTCSLCEKSREAVSFMIGSIPLSFAFRPGERTVPPPPVDDTRVSVADELAKVTTFYVCGECITSLNSYVGAAEIILDMECVCCGNVRVRVPTDSSPRYIKRKEHFVCTMCVELWALIMEEEIGRPVQTQ